MKTGEDIESTCQCGGRIISPATESMFTKGKFIPTQSRCDKCLQDHAEAPERLAKVAQEKRVGQIKIVHKYPDFDWGKLPAPAQAVMESFLKWDPRFDKTGIGLVGDSGMGKSYLSFELRRKLIAKGYSIAVVQDSQLAELQLLKNSDAKSNLTMAVAHAEIVLWDDFGTVKMTDSVEDHINAMLESVNDRGKPIICTTNFPSSKIRERWIKKTGETNWSGSRGDKIINRLTRACNFIKINP